MGIEARLATEILLLCVMLHHLKTLVCDVPYPFRGLGVAQHIADLQRILLMLSGCPDRLKTVEGLIKAFVFLAGSCNYVIKSDLVATIFGMIMRSMTNHLALKRV